LASPHPSLPRHPALRDPRPFVCAAPGPPRPAGIPPPPREIQVSTAGIVVCARRVARRVGPPPPHPPARPGPAGADAPHPVARRLEALDAVVVAAQRGTAQRQAARGTQLQTATSAANAEIEAAEARIAALRQQLAAATAAAQQQDTREQGLASTFEHRAREE